MTLFFIKYFHFSSYRSCTLITIQYSVCCVSHRLFHPVSMSHGSRCSACVARLAILSEESPLDSNNKHRFSMRKMTQLTTCTVPLVLIILSVVVLID